LGAGEYLFGTVKDLADNEIGLQLGSRTVKNKKEKGIETLQAMKKLRRLNFLPPLFEVYRKSR